jgi:hypothetical protein
MRVALRVYARCFRSFYDFLALLHVTLGNVSIRSRDALL